MARRYFEFKNFRNLGLDENNHNKIVINNSLEKGKLGNLVILIGANNSGKSNVLDGILEYGNNKLNPNKDVTTLSFNKENKNPSVALVYEDDEVHIEEKIDISCKKAENTKFYESNHVNKDTAINCLEQIKDYAKDNIGSDVWATTKIQNLIDEINEAGSFNSDHVDKFNDYFNEVKKSKGSSTYINLYDNILLTSLVKIIKELDNVGDYYIQNTYGYNLEPNIIEYEEKEISNNDMNCSIDRLENNLFFKSVFKAIDINISDIINHFDQYKQFTNTASLNQIRKLIDKKIKKLNDQFNKLYFAENDEYKFTIDVESNRIGFGMARGKDEEPIMLEMQSTGFRWFFNLYFNFMCSNDLKTGDIIIMDEPATNLHPKGQEELRSFIKKFAIENDLTFIIATHSPFLIDTNNFDELRLVSMQNNRSSIDNLFTAVNIDDPDSLLPIKEALTIKQNILYDMDTEVVWVEGITDYNYLTMFKNFLNIKNIAFIPYNGNGKTDDDIKKTLNKLINIKFYKCGILVDSDKSGNIMSKMCENTKFKDRTYRISDVSPDLKEIEDMFSKEDKNKYESLNKKSDLFKKSYYSSLMKTTTSIEDYSNETIENFKKLFKIITD